MAMSQAEEFGFFGGSEMPGAASHIDEVIPESDPTTVVVAIPELMPRLRQLLHPAHAPRGSRSVVPKTGCQMTGLP